MDHILVTHPHSYYDNGLLDQALQDYKDQFDGAWYAVINSEADLDISPSESFYDTIIEDLDGNGRMDPADLPDDGDHYVAGGIGQKCLYRTIESIDHVDGLIPELTYVEAAPINRENELKLVYHDETSLRRFGGPLGTDLRTIERLDKVDEPDITLFDSAPFEETYDLIRMNTE